MLNGKFVVVETYCFTIKKGDVLEFVDGYSKEWFEIGNPADKNFVESMEEFNSRYGTQIAPMQITLKEELLTVGRVVELRNGDMAFVLPDRLVMKDGWERLSAYDDDMNLENDEEFDIIGVYDAPITSSGAWNFNCLNKTNLVLGWSRFEIKKTEQQIKIERIENEMRKLADELSELKGK